MNYKFEIIGPEKIDKFLRELQSLEQDIEYPLEDGKGNFIIRHGKEYSPFFTQQGNKTRFVVMKINSQLIGTAAGMWKKISLFDKNYNGLYIADLKIRSGHRKKGILKILLWHLLSRWAFTADYRGWDFCYFCAMLKNGEGVDKSFKGFNPAKLATPSALINIYMVEPTILSALDIKSLPKIDPEKSVNLSPMRNELILWNDGKKDIISSENQSIFRFGHLHPEIFFNENSSNIKEAASIIKTKKGLACFAIDDRQGDIISWLKSNGITTKTKCKIFSFSPFAPSIKHSRNINISTGEI